MRSTCLLATTLALAACHGSGTGDTSTTDTGTTGDTSLTDSADNSWVGPAADPTALPVADDHVATTPTVGDIYSCVTPFNGGGAQADGP